MQQQLPHKQHESKENDLKNADKKKKNYLHMGISNLSIESWRHSTWELSEGWAIQPPT